MALNIEPRTAEDFIPFLKYDAKAGRWFSKPDDGDAFEVRNMTAIFDLDHIKTGWILFSEGMAPEGVWDNGSTASQPSPKHRRGFRLIAFSPKEIGGIREFQSNSNCAIKAIKELYEDQFENAPERRQGLVPVVTCEKVFPVKAAKGTNYQPVLKIQKWVPRPAALPAGIGATAPASDVPPPVQPAAARPATAAAPSDTAGTEEF